MKKTISIITLIFLTTTQTITGRDYPNNKANTSKPLHTGIDKKSNNGIKVDHLENRHRRFLDDEEDKPFWANRGKRSASGRAEGETSDFSRKIKISPVDENHMKFAENARNEAPFWGNRGRRDSKESIEEDYPLKVQRGENFDNIFFKKMLETPKGNSVCFDVKSFAESDKYRQNFLPEDILTFKERREEEINPFWGVRGRRGSDEENEEAPFWGNRGRRDDDGPFWGARGRREDDAPFWGSRGRRDENGPFWGARGRRENDVPFWGVRGRREEENPFWGNRGRRSDEDVTGDLLNALKNIKSELYRASRSKRSANDYIENSEGSFWQNRGRNGGLQYLFDDKHRLKSDKNHPSFQGHKTQLHDLTTMKSLRQDRLYADQPYYIVVDRSSRSTGLDDDPYFISRGKKLMSRTDFAKAARDRRGIIEQIAKSFQDDPYFAVRGKKDDEEVKNNKKQRYEQLVKAKELICSAVVLMNSKNDARNKRELSDRDRNRRAILKKLAAQLQNDPYFVSRGKKSLDLNIDDVRLEEFIKQMSEMCS